MVRRHAVVAETGTLQRWPLLTDRVLQHYVQQLAQTHAEGEGNLPTTTDRMTDEDHNEQTAVIINTFVWSRAMTLGSVAMSSRPRGYMPFGPGSCNYVCTKLAGNWKKRAALEPG